MEKEDDKFPSRLWWAVRAKFSSHAAEEHGTHSAPDDAFEGRLLSPSTAAELARQLRQRGARDSLRACLLDIDRFLFIMEQERNELLDHWVWLGEEGTMGKAYLKAFECWSGAPRRVEQSISHAANQLAIFLCQASLYAEAEPLICRAIAIDEDTLGKDHREVAANINNLATLFQSTNRLAEAEPLYRRALSIWERSLGENDPYVATGLNNLAQLLKATNRPTEAEPLLRRALAIDEQRLGADHPDVAIALNNLAVLLMETNRISEAEPLMRRRLSIFVKCTCTTGYPRPHLQGAVDNYAALVQSMARSEEEVLAALCEVAPGFFAN